MNDTTNAQLILTAIALALIAVGLWWMSPPVALVGIGGLLLAGIVSVRLTKPKE